MGVMLLATHEKENDGPNVIIEAEKVDAWTTIDSLVKIPGNGYQPRTFIKVYMGAREFYLYPNFINTKEAEMALALVMRRTGLKVLDLRTEGEPNPITLSGRRLETDV